MFNLDINNPCHVHFIGIGGVSMSGLAEVLIENGFKVSGSDQAPSEITERLKARGAEIKYPQSRENAAPDTDICVYTAAIHPDNPEFMAFKELSVPMLSRAQFLGQLMRFYPNSVAVAGTHGKTTTTGMIGEILLEAGRNAGGEGKPYKVPTISIGGILPSIGSNICVGNSDVFLTEACEYTNSYHEFYPKYSVILNIEEDHMDFFKDINDIRKSFRRFAENTSQDGVLVIGSDIADINEITDSLPCRIVTFGEGDSDYTAKDIHVKEDEEGAQTVFTVVFRGKDIGELVLLVPGNHNIKNALAAVAITREMGIDFPTIKKAILAFHGAERRFQYRGDINGAKLYDDYAHHPTEIAATIAAARSLPHKRLIIIFQPHTYTRTKAFLTEFAEVLSRADIIGVVPVYPAREEDVYGVHSEDIARLINERIEKKAVGCEAKECHFLSDFSEVEKFIKKISSTGDLLITMGAGDIVKVADSIIS